MQQLFQQVKVKMFIWEAVCNFLTHIAFLYCLFQALHYPGACLSAAQKEQWNIRTQEVESEGPMGFLALLLTGYGILVKSIPLSSSE